MPEEEPKESTPDEGGQEGGPDLLAYKEWTARSPDMPGYGEQRERYLDELERVYGEFTDEYGKVAPGDSLRDYLVGVKNLLEFQNKQKEENPKIDSRYMYYDLGYRFLIDALLEGDDHLQTEEKDYIRDFLMQGSPYYNHLFKARPKYIDDFVEKYPNQDGLVDSLEYLYKKSLKQSRIEDAPCFIKRIPGVPVYKIGVNPESEWHDLQHPISDMVKNPTLCDEVFYGIITKRDIIQPERVGELEKEALEELLKEADSQFRGGFKIVEKR